MIGLVAALLVSPKATSATNFEGALVIGSTRYSVNITIAHVKPEMVRFEISISQSIHQVAQAVAEIQPDSGVLTMNGLAYNVPPTIASRWWQQITKGALESAGFTCHRAPEGASICETPALVSLMHGLPAKVRLQGRGAQRNMPAPEEIRIFSLEEWDNLFREYVSIGISRTATEDEP